MKSLQDFIVFQLRLGLQDSDDELVSATFSALQYLVPVLGAHVIVGGERIQQFTERRPKVCGDFAIMDDSPFRQILELGIFIITAEKSIINLVKL